MRASRRETVIDFNSNCVIRVWPESVLMHALPINGQLERAATATYDQFSGCFCWGLASPLIAVIGRSSRREVESGLNQMAVVAGRHFGGSRESLDVINGAGCR